MKLWSSFFTSFEIVSHAGFEKLRGSCLILKKVSSWSFPANGVAPLSKRKRKTPRDQISDL